MRALSARTIAPRTRTKYVLPVQTQKRGIYSPKIPPNRRAPWRRRRRCYTAPFDLIEVIERSRTLWSMPRATWLLRAGSRSQCKSLSTPAHENPGCRHGIRLISYLNSTKSPALPQAFSTAQEPTSDASAGLFDSCSARAAAAGSSGFAASEQAPGRRPC